MVHLGPICPINNSLRAGRVAVQSRSPLSSDYQAVKHTISEYCAFWTLTRHQSLLRFSKATSSSSTLCADGSQTLEVIRISERSVKHRWLCPTPRAPDSVGLERGPRMHISNKCPGEVDAIGPGTTL